MRSPRTQIAALALALAGSFASSNLFAGPQGSGSERPPLPADKLLIALSPQDATAKVFLAAGTRLDLLKTIATGKGPEDISITKDAKTAYVINSLDDSITVIDLDALKVTGTLLPA